MVILSVVILPQAARCSSAHSGAKTSGGKPPRVALEPIVPRAKDTSAKPLVRRRVIYGGSFGDRFGESLELLFFLRVADILVVFV